LQRLFARQTTPGVLRPRRTAYISPA
jgi:hypothetical protein